MAVNTSFSAPILEVAQATSTLTGAVTSTTNSGKGRKSAFAQNGNNSYFISCSSAAAFYRFDYSSPSSSISSVATFANSEWWVDLAIKSTGTEAYFVSANDGSVVNFYRFNPASVSGAQSTPTATFANDSGVRVCQLLYNAATPSQSLLFVGGASTVVVYRIDPGAVTGTYTTASTEKIATFSCGISPWSLNVIENGANSLFMVCGFGGNAILSRFNSASLSGTIPSVASFATGSSCWAGALFYNASTPAKSYLFFRVNFDSDIAVWQVNPLTVTGTPSRKGNITYTGTNIDNFSNFAFIEKGDKSLLFLGLAGSGINAGGVQVHQFDVSTLSGTRPASSAFFTADPINVGTKVHLFENGGTSGLFVSGRSSDGNVLLYKGDLNARSVVIAMITPFLAGASFNIRKASGGVITIYAAVSAFEAFLQLKFGANISESGLGTQVYGYAFSASNDNTGTLNEDFTYSGSNATITGNYSLTLGASRTLTLGTKGTYTDSWIIPSTGTVVLTANTVITSEMILVAGTTVSGAFSLTLPYSDPGLVLVGGATIIAPTVSIVLSGIPLNAGAIVGVIDLTTMAQTFPTITSGTATIPTNPARNYFIACDARGYLRQTVTLAGNVPSFTFSLTNYTALYNAGVSRASDISFNTSTYEVMIGDGTANLSLADVFHTIEDYLATQQAIFFSTQPYPVIVDTGVGGVRQYLFFPYDFTANTPNPLRIKPKATNTIDPTLTDFVIVHVGSTAPLFTIFDFTGAGGRVIRYQTEAVAATVTVSGSGALTTAQAAQLAALNAALVSSGVFSAAALANAPSAGGGGLTAQQVRDALTLSTAVTAAAGSIDAKLTAIPTTPLLTADTRLNNLDAAVSSRLAATGYVAPANTSILNAIGAIPTTPLLTGDTRLNNLDAAVSSRQATFTYTAPDNAGITTIQNLLAAIEGAGFNTSTDSLHAIRARGDSSWTTAAESFTPADRLTIAALPTLASIEASAIIAKEATAQTAANNAQNAANNAAANL